MNVHALAIVRGCDVLPKNLHTRDSADVTGRYICEDYRARDLFQAMRVSSIHVFIRTVQQARNSIQGDQEGHTRSNILYTLLDNAKDNSGPQTDQLGRRGRWFRLRVVFQIIRTQRTRLPAPTLADRKHVRNARESCGGGTNRARAGNREIGGHRRSRVSVWVWRGNRCRRDRDRVTRRLVDCNRCMWC